jgi:flagellar biosynthesis/type III secretory pathway M-ring protein FliF/YscJ
VVRTREALAGDRGEESVKELVKRAAEALQAAGELLRKLPRRDKWVLAVIVVLLVFVGGVLLFLDGGQDYQRVWSSRETDSPLALQRFAARLSENGIAWSPGQLPGGERTISVPAASLEPRSGAA